MLVSPYPAKDRLDDYLLPNAEDLEEFSLFDGDEGFYAHDENALFYDEWSA